MRDLLVEPASSTKQDHPAAITNADLNELPDAIRAGGDIDGSAAPDAGRRPQRGPRARHRTEVARQLRSLAWEACPHTSQNSTSRRSDGSAGLGSPTDFATRSASR